MPPVWPAEQLGLLEASPASLPSEHVDIYSLSGSSASSPAADPLTWDGLENILETVPLDMPEGLEDPGFLSYLADDSSSPPLLPPTSFSSDMDVATGNDSDQDSSGQPPAKRRARMPKVKKEPSAKDLLTGIDQQLQQKNLDPDMELILKKQRRMMKNRESASLSRLRKKQHLDSLETQLKTCQGQLEARDKQIAALKAENMRLTEEVRALRAAAPAGSWISPPALGAAGTTLLVCLLCFSLFSNPAGQAGGLMGGSAGGAVSRQAPFGLDRPASLLSFGRTLKSHAQPAVGLLESKQSAAASGDGGVAGKDLQGLLAEHQARLLSYMNATTLEAVERSSSGNVSVSSSSTGLVQPTTSTDDLAFDASPLYRLGDAARPAMFRTITRRTDTSYIFCTEVQVVGTKTKDNSRLSLVIPTPHQKSANGTSTLLQIDCDVARTRVLTMDDQPYIGA